MKLAVFLSDWRRTEETLERLKADKLGIILVENGIYHAVVKEGGRTHPSCPKRARPSTPSRTTSKTRGYTAANVNPKVKLVNYGDIVDLIMKDYEKTACCNLNSGAHFFRVASMAWRSNLQGGYHG